MADEKNTSTYAVKLDGEVKQELQALLEGYKEGTGATSGEFIKTLIEVYKTNKIVAKVSSTDADIKELNTLTSRIYSIYSNLIERNSNNNNALQLEFSEQLGQKDNEINNLKAKLQDMEQKQQELKQTFNTICDDKKDLESKNIQLQKLNDSLELNNSKLIEDTKGLHELKDVNNKLSNEIETTKELLADSQSKNIELGNSIKEKNSMIENLNNEVVVVKQVKETTVQELNIKHNEVIETIKEKAEIQKDKDILELKTQYQQELQEEKDKYNNKINEYQNKYEKLFDEFKELQKTTTKNNTGVVQNKQTTK